VHVDQTVGLSATRPGVMLVGARPLAQEHDDDLSNIDLAGVRAVGDLKVPLSVAVMAVQAFQFRLRKVISRCLVGHPQTP